MMFIKIPKSVLLSAEKYCKPLTYFIYPASRWDRRTSPDNKEQVTCEDERRILQIWPVLNFASHEMSKFIYILTLERI
jgi:hypothetical protein